MRRSISTWVATHRDERLKTFGQNQGGATQFDDLDLTLGNENVEGAATDTNVAAGVGYSHGDGLDRMIVPPWGSVAGLLAHPWRYPGPRVGGN